jgi:hypothetical protein
VKTGVSGYEEFATADPRMEALSDMAHEALAKPCGCVVVSDEEARQIEAALRTPSRPHHDWVTQAEAAIALLRERSADA